MRLTPASAGRTAIPPVPRSTADLDVKDVAELVSVLQQVVADDAGVVHEHGRLAELGGDPLDHSLDGGLGDVDAVSGRDPSDRPPLEAQVHLPATAAGARRAFASCPFIGVVNEHRYAA